MTDRSVAEIMGWTFTPSFPENGICHVGDWRDHQGNLVSEHHRYNATRKPNPTPDDMLAWLSANVRDGEWNTEGDIGIVYQHDDMDAYVEVQWYCEAGSEIVAGPNLHAALEAAVRAVGCAGIEPAT